MKSLVALLAMLVLMLLLFASAPAYTALDPVMQQGDIVAYESPMKVPIEAVQEHTYHMAIGHHIALLDDSRIGDAIQNNAGTDYRLRPNTGQMIDMTMATAFIASINKWMILATSTTAEKGMIAHPGITKWIGDQTFG